MKFQNFQDMEMWKSAKNLAVIIHKIFSNSRDYLFRDQIERAVITIMNNLAEGFDRRSDKQFKYFLFIARGSCAEVRSMAILGFELGYLKNKDPKIIEDLYVDISKMIIGMTKYLNRKLTINDLVLTTNDRDQIFISLIHHSPVATHD